MFKSVVFFVLFAVVSCRSADDYDPPINDEPAINKISNLPCPAGWTYLPNYGKCLLATIKDLTWHEAEAYCVKLGGHLMSFHGNDEIKRAYDIVEDNFWVGLYKSVNEKENTWRFANNETFHYAMWGGEGSSPCVHAYNNRVYSEVNCDRKWPGICQVYPTS